MIKHIVCFKLKDNSPEACQKSKDILLSMQGRVEQLRGIEAGIDFLHSERSYDLVLQVLVENEEELEAYQNHPYHVEVVKKHMHEVRSASVAVDYIV